MQLFFRIKVGKNNNLNGKKIKSDLDAKKIVPFPMIAIAKT